MSNEPITDQRKLGASHHLGEAMLLGSGGAITAQERQGGAEIQAQDTSDWVQVPAEMKGHDRFGAAVRWTEQRDIDDYESLGFEFHPDDRAVLLRVAALKVAFDEQRKPLYGDEYNNGGREKVAALFREENEQAVAIWGDRDELFIRARLPEGWRFEDAGHRYGYWSYIEDADGFERVAIFYKAAFYDRRAHMSITTVPETKAQKDAWNRFYDADDIGYSSDGPYWRTVGLEAAEGRHALHRLEWTADDRTRELVIAPDGAITRDEISD